MPCNSFYSKCTAAITHPQIDADILSKGRKKYPSGNMPAIYGCTNASSRGYLD